jgi:hypothetical protein
MTREEKLRIARALERMRVDVIEAGFPASSNGDFEAVRAIAGTVRESVVCGLCRANDKDIQRGVDAHSLQRPGDAQLLVAGHRGAGALLAVAHGGVENDQAFFSHRNGPCPSRGLTPFGGSDSTDCRQE